MLSRIMHNKTEKRWVLSAIIALGLGAQSSFGAGAPQPDPLAGAMEDPRTPINLTEPEKNLVLWEMRSMLVAVQGITAGLDAGDLKKVAQAATAMGTATADLIPPETVAKLPQTFQELAGATHSNFDSISIGAKDGETNDMIIFRLADMLNTCVACHAIYRINVVPE